MRNKLFLQNILDWLTFTICAITTVFIIVNSNITIVFFNMPITNMYLLGFLGCILLFRSVKNLFNKKSNWGDSFLLVFSFIILIFSAYALYEISIWYVNSPEGTFTYKGLKLIKKASLEEKISFYNTCMVSYINLAIEKNAELHEYLKATPLVTFNLNELMATPYYDIPEYASQRFNFAISEYARLLELSTNKYNFTYKKLLVAVGITIAIAYIIFNTNAGTTALAMLNLRTQNLTTEVINNNIALTRQVEQLLMDNVRLTNITNRLSDSILHLVDNNQAFQEKIQRLLQFNFNMYVPLLTNQPVNVRSILLGNLLRNDLDFINI